MIRQSSGKDMNSCDDAEICQEDKIGVSIIYAYEDSDIFYPAKLLRHGINCLCFASQESITEGEKIFIMTQDFPIEGTSIKIYEGCFAQVEECKKYEDIINAASYLIRGKALSGKTMKRDSNELGVEVL